MSTTKHSGLCRCCLLEGYHRSLSDTYQFKGYANSYSDLIAKSLNIYLKKASGPLAEMTYQICEDCATKIKHIAVFRDQVLQCEEMFQKMYSNQTLRASELDIIKEEDPDSDVEIILKEEDTSLNLPDCQKEEADSNPVLDDDNIEDSDHDNDRHSDIQEEIPPEVSEKEQCNEGKTVETPAVTNDNRLSDDDDFYWEDSEMDTMISGPLLVPDTTPAPDVIDGKKTTRYSKRIKKQNDIKPKVKASSKKAKQKPNDQSEEKPKEKSKASSKKAQQNTNESSEENSILKASLLKFSYPPCSADYTKLINGKLKCKRCDKTTRSEAAMNRHINIVHLKMPYHLCKLCNGRFRTRSQFTKHKLNVHNIDDRVRCNACDAFFDAKSRLQFHMLNFHKLGTRIKCPQCDYECYSNEALTKHSYAHGNREYNCKYCPKSFKRCSNLTQHLKIHTGDKKKVCKECGQAFVQKASLNYHMGKYHPGVPF